MTSRIATVTALQGEPAITSFDDLPVELLLKMSNFALSVRARRCLEKQGIDRVGDLVTLSEIDLLRAKNCGRKTLKEIRSAIGSLGFSLRMKVPVWKKIDADEFAKRHATVLGRIRRRLSKQLYALDSSAGVEAEIASAIAGVMKTKDQAKIELWLGLDQSVSPTLQQVGEVADVTRERIRQIVQRAQRNLQGAKLDMKKLRASIKLLEKAVVLSDRAAIQLLEYECLVDVKVTVRGLLRAAELFGVKTKLTREQVGDVEFVGLSRGLALLKSIRREGRRAVRKWGCSTLEDVAAEVNDKVNGRFNVTPELVRDILMTQPAFCWLDQESGWFWLEDVRRNRLLNKIDKILAASPQVDLAALRAGIARHYRMEGFSPPSRVLQALCEQLEDCEVLGGRIVVDKRPRPARELSEHERTMLKVFREHGPVLSYADARQLCIDAGLNESTTGMYLGNSPIFRRVAVGIYTEIGSCCEPRSSNGRRQDSQRVAPNQGHAGLRLGAEWLGGVGHLQGLRWHAAQRRSRSAGGRQEVHHRRQLQVARSRRYQGRSNRDA